MRVFFNTLSIRKTIRRDDERGATRRKFQLDRLTSRRYSFFSSPHTIKVLRPGPNVTIAAFMRASFFRHRSPG